MPAIFSPESLSASGKSSEKLSLPSLQSKMKSDPSGYLSELQLIIRRFESSLDLFRRSSALNPSSDPAVSKELADLAMFLAHVSPFYAEELRELPNQVAELLREDGRALPSSLRCHLAQALILLVNRKVSKFWFLGFWELIGICLPSLIISLWYLWVMLYLKKLWSLFFYCL